jgi:putative ABC transport system substrate-binding protein
MRRRQFIVGLGGTAAWPLAVRAQQPDRMRRIGVLMPISADDPESPPRMAVFQKALRQLGWVDGRNARFEVRWGAGDLDRIRQNAAEVVALAPDVIFATGNEIMAPLQQATRSIPIVFVLANDPVGAGYVDSLARPSGNTTGFMLSEYGFSGKLLELLKQIAPGVVRVAVIRESAMAAGIGAFAAIQSVASSVGVEVRPLDSHDAGEIERGITAFSRLPNGGLIVTGSASAVVHRDLIVILAVRHKLPAVYWTRVLVTGGGLVSYGIDLTNEYARAATYVDHILKGEKPADLPVQTPTKYELAINLKTANALGLEIPLGLLTTADEVIQ